MDDNVLSVLQMLQDGKISPQEAEQLIAALRGEAPPAPEEAKPSEGATEEKEDHSLFDALPFGKLNDKINETMKDVKPPRINFEGWGERISQAVAKVQPEKIVKRVQTEIRRASRASASFTSNVSSRVRSWTDGDDSRPTNSMNLPNSSESIDQEFHLEPGASILVENPLGAVSVVGTTEGTASVKITKMAWAATEEEVKEVAASIEVNVHGTDSRLEIKVTAPDTFRDGTVDLELKVPRNAANVRVSTHYGALELSELDGLAEGVTTSGALQLHDLAGDVRGETAGGALTVARVAGLVTVASQSGDITVEDVKKGLVATTASGDVKATGVEGGSVECRSVSGDATLVKAGLAAPVDITVESVSGNATLQEGKGNISIKAVSGNVKADSLVASRLQAQTVSGDVSLRVIEAFAGTLQVNTVSGDVKVALTAGSSARMSLGTTSGEMKCELEASDTHVSETLWTGQLGEGTGTVTIQTISGDVHILKAESSEQASA